MKYLIAFFSLLLFAGCSLFENSDLEASFIHFERPLVSTLLEQGSDGHAVEDYWLELEGDDLGVYPVNRTVPFLPQTNPTTIFVFPGIKNNGFQADAVIYPFFDVLEIEKSFVPDAVDTIQPTFRYREETKFSFVEGFDGGLLFGRDEDEDEDNGMTIETIDGNNVGVLTLTEDHPEIAVSNVVNYLDIPKTQQPVYLELEYKNNINFSVGIIGVLSATQDFINLKIVLRPQEDWNKIYIDFTDEVILSDLDAYRIVFASVYEPDVNEEQKIYIDNVKLVHF